MLAAPQVWLPRAAMLRAALWSAFSVTPQVLQAKAAWLGRFGRPGAETDD